MEQQLEASGQRRKEISLGRFPPMLALSLTASVLACARARAEADTGCGH